MARRLAALLAAVLLTAGCSTPSSAAPQGFTTGSTAHVLSVRGLDRSYRLYIPEAVQNPAPLVVMLHGGFGSAQQAERAYGWDELAHSAKFVVAYPDGVDRAWNVNGDCCGRPARENIDDVGCINAVGNDISGHAGIDPTRVYATGISNGGMMAYTLACDVGTFAAIGPDSATQLDDCATPHPTSVMHIHGNVDQCGAPAITTNGPVTTSTADCPDGRNVVLMTVDGGGHEWPSFATQALWQFFAAH
jgi:polyhydroxybutyrate depolymerase